MAIKFTGEIDLAKLVERLANFVFGTVGSILIASGLGFIGFGKWDVVVYSIQSVLLHMQVEPPGQSMGWQDWLGVILLAIGLLIKLKTWVSSQRKEQRTAKLKFKSDFASLTDAQIQDGMDHLYGIRHADVSHCKKIFAHPRDVDGAIFLYKICRYHLRNDGIWFEPNSKYLKFRSTVGFWIWLAIPTHALVCAILALTEFIKPGILNSGPHADIVLGLIAAADIVGAALIFSDLKKMSTALTFMREYKP